MKLLLNFISPTAQHLILWVLQLAHTHAGGAASPRIQQA
jgi:hypothetical protein